MGKELKKIEDEIRDALKAEGLYREGMQFRIRIAAGAALLHKKLLDDIEKLKSPVIRDGEDMDFVPAPDEAVRLLPHAAKEYHNAKLANLKAKLAAIDGLIDEAKEHPIITQDELFATDVLARELVTLYIERIEIDDKNDKITVKLKEM